jgi:uncharacterized membrane protein
MNDKNRFVKIGATLCTVASFVAAPVFFAAVIPREEPNLGVAAVLTIYLHFATPAFALLWIGGFACFIVWIIQGD